SISVKKEPLPTKIILDSQKDEEKILSVRYGGKSIGVIKLGGLLTLDLSNMGITDIREIKGLENLKNLQRLSLQGNQITEIRGLENLTNLQELLLRGNQIKDIEGLVNLINLQSLSLEENKITEIKGLKNLRNLQRLYLHRNQITEIKGLENLTNLQILHLHTNKITEIKGLENLTNLHELYLQGNKLAELKGIENLKELSWINLKNNKITEIKGLENLTNLHRLFLQENQITELKGLENLKKLLWIDFKNNPIETWIIKEFGKNYGRKPNRLVNYCRYLKDKAQSAKKEQLATKITSVPQGKIEQVYPLPFAAYKGNDPYIFVSYSHKDKIFVYPEIELLHSEGFHIWYDEGIPLSKSWHDEVAKAVKNCTCFIVFISDNSIQSKFVENEINYALKYNKHTIPIYIEDTILPDGLEMQLITIQGIYKHQMDEIQYYEKIHSDLKKLLI
ncbi:MAG: leucine-rich repeat domain-containing protein, partial [Candidatus Hodarchaeota archaeon]